MLTEVEIQEIRAELQRYEHPQAVSIDALKIVQQHRGWVSDEALKDVADFLGMSTAEYALGTVTAVAFAGVLYVILTGGTVSEVLTELVVDALNSGP